MSLTHPEGKSKAKFFRGIGFNETTIEEFEKALLKIGKLNEVKEIDKRKSKYVIKYIIYGLIDAPNSKQYKIKTVWAINVGMERREQNHHPKEERSAKDLFRESD